MRISDWSSDVCSSDLHRVVGAVLHLLEQHRALRAGDGGVADPGDVGLSGRGNGGVVALFVHRRSPSLRFRCRSEEHTSELQSLMRISNAVLCLNKKKMLSKYTIDINLQ